VVGVSEGELWVKAMQDCSDPKVRFEEELRQLRAGGDEKMGRHKEIVRFKDSDLARQQRRHGLTFRIQERLMANLLWTVTFYDRFADEGGLLRDGRFDVESVGWEGSKGGELIGSAVRCYDLPEVSNSYAFLPGSEVVDM